MKCGLGLHLLGGIRSSNGRDVVCGRIGTFALGGSYAQRVWVVCSF